MENGESESPYWFGLLVVEMCENQECWDDVEASTHTEEDFALLSQGCESPDGDGGFLVWTKERVYFPVIVADSYYNPGRDYVASVPRWECNEKLVIC